MIGVSGKREGPMLLDIADRWQRVLAAFIDAVLVLVLLMALALLLDTVYYASGPYGRLISFGIVVAYFTIFSSKYGRGQTPGKRATGIAVRNAQGKYLTLRQALVRSLVLGAIILFSSWDIPLIFTSSALTILAKAIVWGGIVTIFYGYVVDVNTRQTPYDVLVGSYVVIKPYPFEPPEAYYVPERVPRHLSAILGLLVTSQLVSIALTVAFLDSDLLALEKTLNNDSTFFSVRATLDGDRLALRASYSKHVNEAECYDLAYQLMLDAYNSYADRGALKTIEVRIFREIDLMVNRVYDTLCTESWSR